MQKPAAKYIWPDKMHKDCRNRPKGETDYDIGQLSIHARRLRRAAARVKGTYRRAGDEGWLRWQNTERRI